MSEKQTDKIYETLIALGFDVFTHNIECGRKVYRAADAQNNIFTPQADTLGILDKLPKGFGYKFKDIISSSPEGVKTRTLFTSILAKGEVLTDIENDISSYSDLIDYNNSVITCIAGVLKLDLNDFNQ